MWIAAGFKPAATCFHHARFRYHNSKRFQGKMCCLVAFPFSHINMQGTRKLKLTIHGLLAPPLSGPLGFIFGDRFVLKSQTLAHTWMHTRTQTNPMLHCFGQLLRHHTCRLNAACVNKYLFKCSTLGLHIRRSGKPHARNTRAIQTYRHALMDRHPIQINCYRTSTHLQWLLGYRLCESGGSKLQVEHCEASSLLWGQE